MGRPAKFDREELLSAALQQLSEGTLTVKTLAERTGASTGSIYHRFDSIDALIGELWTRAVTSFQEAFVAELEGADTLEAGVRAAVHTPRWAREHPRECVLLLTRRRSELVRAFPEALGARLKKTHERSARVVRAYTRRHFGTRSKDTVEATRFALVDVPYAITRRHLLEGHPPPTRVDALVERTARTILTR